MAGTAATAMAIGSMAWYYHLYGSELHAMTPAEEGLVCYPGASTVLDRCSAGRWNWGHRESRNEGDLNDSKGHIADFTVVCTRLNTHGFTNNT